MYDGMILAMLVVETAFALLLVLWLSKKQRKKDIQWAADNPVPDRPLLRREDLKVVVELTADGYEVPVIWAPGGRQRGSYLLSDEGLTPIKTVPFEIEDVMTHLRIHRRL